MKLQISFQKTLSGMRKWLSSIYLILPPYLKHIQKLEELSPNLKKKIYESLFGEATELFIEL